MDCCGEAAREAGVPPPFDTKLVHEATEESGAIFTGGATNEDCALEGCCNPPEEADVARRMPPSSSQDVISGAAGRGVPPE